MAVETHEGRLERVVDRGPDTRSLFVTRPPGFTFRPGQFVSCLLPVAADTLIRPYSIASSPEDQGPLELLLDRVPGGPGSGHLFGLAPGAHVRFTGPWGTFALERAPETEAVFVAERTGIAPIRPMLRRAAATGHHRLHLLHGTDHRFYGDELAALPRVHVEVVSRDALAAEVARRWIEADADRGRHFFICGIGAIVPHLRDLLRTAGYARHAVQYEKW